MNPNTLSGKEKLIYDYIVEKLKKEGYSPSVRDIQLALGYKSTSTVHMYLEKLEKKGYISKESGKSRTIRVDDTVVPTKRTMKVPIIGQVTAGVPILAVENHDGYIEFPITNHSYIGKHLFALRVKGESMIEEGIMDGDLIVVEKRNWAEDGEIVVALVDDEATVKKFYRENGRFRLQPANHTMKPIYVEEVYILGHVIANLRFY